MEPRMLDVDGVAKRFGRTQALAGVTLAAGEGTVLGLLGPNGAGKTTLVRIIATLLHPDAGRVRVKGVDVVRDPRGARRIIGLAGQAAAVDELLTGRENLDLVAHLYGLSREDRHRRVGAMLERLELADAADRRVGTYSGGMRRRLDLGATLVGRPSVVLLDEPTAGLDPRSRNEVWSMVEALAAEGATVLLTSQYLHEVERLANHIVVIDHGVVVAEGSAPDLKTAVGGDVLEAEVIEARDLDAAESLVLDLGSGTAHIDRDNRRVSVPTGGGTPALVAAARRLDDAGIELADLTLRRPSLDDVFLALTEDTRR